MQDNTMDVRPQQFAQTHLDAADRAPFAEAMRAADIDPGVAFEKDTSLVKVNGFKMQFESGMVLVGKNEDLDSDRVEIEPEGSDTPGVHINDAIKRLGGR
jgi:hypothetical protein